MHEIFIEKKYWNSQSINNNPEARTLQIRSARRHMFVQKREQYFRILSAFSARAR